MDNLDLSNAQLRMNNKLGWAEPHSRFPLGFPMNLSYEIWVLVLRSHKSSTCILLGCHPLNSLKFKKDPISDCWDIPLLILWGCLLVEVIQLLTFWGLLHFKQYSILVWSSQLKLDIWGGFILIFWGHLPLEDLFINKNYQSRFGHIDFSFKVEEDPISVCLGIPF